MPTLEVPPVAQPSMREAFSRVGKNSRAGLRLLLTWEAGDAGADGTVPWGTKMLLDADGLRGAGHCNWQIKEAGRMVKHPASLE
ncbi:MAG TPA: hypothetical protein DCL45_12380 [Chloroflexi bacterium]|nr:hypothetical protein [Chloroflexota bacterium]